MLAAITFALALSAPTTFTSGAERPQAPIMETLASTTPLQQELLQADPNSPDTEPSFVDRYLSFQLSPMAAQQSKDGLVLGHILGYVFSPICGTLWGPIVAVDGASFSGDVVITWFLSSILWGIIASAVSLTGIGVIMFLALPYLGSTATFNEIDRQLKKSGKAKGVEPPRGTPPAATTPPAGETPPPSYAY